MSDSATLNPSFEVPEGIDLEESSGRLSGKPLFRVRAFNMPWQGSPEAAVRVYSALHKANESGYFNTAALKASKNSS